MYISIYCTIVWETSKLLTHLHLLIYSNGYPKQLFWAKNVSVHFKVNLKKIETVSSNIAVTGCDNFYLQM
jgi:hypothetical protein